MSVKRGNGAEDILVFCCVFHDKENWTLSFGQTLTEHETDRRLSKNPDDPQPFLLGPAALPVSNPFKPSQAHPSLWCSLGGSFLET